MSSELSADGEQLVRELEAQCREWLTPQIERISGGAFKPRPKVINDAVWGSIHVHAWEVALLDSALLQRLRFLRQLGVAHWVYPSAGHSRLEHSLGVMHQAQAILTSLERSSSRADEPLFTDDVAKLMRLAALVHDCGHTVMSHVSERLVEKLPGVGALRSYLHREYRARKPPSPSEAFAAIFVNSPAFKELLSLPQTGADFIKDVDEACKIIAGFILSAPVVPARAFLSLILSGATDADKLDYMPRDSLMAGVPVPVDVRRVIEKLRVLDVPVDRLPFTYQKWTGQKSPTEKILVLASSGQRALVELAMGRTVLYEKIYQHQKVRALEVMVRRSLSEHGPKTVPEWLKRVDDDLIADTRFAPIRNRELLKRALVLPAPSVPDQEEPWRKLTGFAKGGQESQLAAFQAALVPRAKEFALALGMDPTILDACPPEVDRTDPGKQKLDEFAYVGDSGAEITQASPATAGQRAEAGKDATRQIIHVFSPEATTLPVFLAARELLTTEYGFFVGPEAFRPTRLDHDAIEEAEKTLADAGHQLAVSLDTDDGDGHRLVSNKQEALEVFLRVAAPRIAVLARAFGRYQAQDGSPVGHGEITGFLRQFQTESRARSALRMLEAVRFVDRPQLASRMTEVLTTYDDVLGIAALGGPGDSSAFVSYLINDLREELRREVRDLELLLDKEEPGRIVLWDDFCGRGGHTITVLAQWLGLNTERALNEKLVGLLSDDRREKLRNVPVVLAFGFARQSGLDQLRAFLDEQGLQNIEISAEVPIIEEVGPLFSSSEVLGDERSRAALEVFCKEKGRELLEEKATRREEPISPEELEDRLLGYGNGAHLLVFPYNVPTVSLTLLWEKGLDWVPLFPRRTKPSASVDLHRHPGASALGKRRRRRESDV